MTPEGTKMLAGKIVQAKKELTQTTVKVSGVSNLNQR